MEAVAPFSAAWKRHFMEHYWQKRPLLIRKYRPNFESPVSGDELAGLACEGVLHSRVCMGEGPERKWQLFEGPFSESFFQQLPATKWQLLVNGVDRAVPAIAALLTDFDFVPRWRIDDVMVSYAAPGGGVGPHSDSYDVFLLQGEGRKRWSVSVSCKFDPDDAELHEEDLDVRILNDFVPEASWVLEPGDMLYVPPQTAHHGEALDAGQTISIGFLAPKASDVIAAYVCEMTEQMNPSTRYADADMEVQEHPGEMSAATIAKVMKMIDSIPRGHDDVAAWLGRHLTVPRGLPEPCPLDPPLTLEELLHRLQRQDDLVRNESSRMVWARMQSGACTLFVDSLVFRRGIAPDSPMLKLVQLLTTGVDLQYSEIKEWAVQDESLLDLLLDLVNDGHLYFKSEQDSTDDGALDSDVDAGCFDLA